MSSVHTETKSRRFQIPVWRTLSKKLRFGDWLEWIVGLTVEIKPCVLKSVSPGGVDAASFIHACPIHAFIHSLILCYLLMNYLFKARLDNPIQWIKHYSVTHKHSPKPLRCVERNEKHCTSFGQSELGGSIFLFLFGLMYLNKLI